LKFHEKLSNIPLDSTTDRVDPGQGSKFVFHPFVAKMIQLSGKYGVFVTTFPLTTPIRNCSPNSHQFGRQIPRKQKGHILFLPNPILIYLSASEYPKMKKMKSPGEAYSFVN
jgi:hypothetical protein